MIPVTGIVEKKTVDGVLAWAKSLWNRERDLKARIAELEAVLATEHSGEAAFERLMSTLICRPEDDHMWFKKAGTGGPYCPLCLPQTKQLRPLIAVSGKAGEFECYVHDRRFETAERRRHVEQNPRRSVRMRRVRGPQAWMVR
jgi:hypothetical protein